MLVASFIGDMSVLIFFAWVTIAGFGYIMKRLAERSPAAAKASTGLLVQLVRWFFS
jgi:hypothetical protein